MILQGYFDDSGSHSDSALYVVAGFMARADKWIDFSKQWRSLLDREPSIAVMHCADAYAQSGEFGTGWTVPLIRQRLYECAELIPRFAALRVQACVKRSDFDYFIKGIAPDPELNDPYFFCFYKILAEIAKSHAVMDACIETIFDEQGAIGTRSLMHWDYLRSLYPNEFIQFERPTFKSDRQTMPLQAADMYAYHLYSRIRDNFAGEIRLDAKHIDKVIASIPHLSCIMERDEVIAIGCGLLAARDSQYRG